MVFKKIQISNYRNIETLEINFSEGVNIFIGLNGQGKTNLLEALYILSHGDSFRYADNSTIIKSGCDQAQLRTLVEKNSLEFDLSLQILKSRRHFLLNSKRAQTGEIQSLFPSIVFSPESLAAIKEGADQRRRLLDELLIMLQPKNAQIVAEFKKALKFRNKVLKQGLSPDIPIRQTEALLESINPSFIRLATELTQMRLQAIYEIKEDFQKAYQEITHKNVDISVEYVISSEKIVITDIKNIENRLKNRIQELRSAELSTGASLVGPQKHDIEFIYNGNNSRFYCSQGQQRALILAFKMAQIVYHRRVHGSYPVLMLDDVLSELDLEKKSALLEFLQKIRTQIFITATDLDFSTSLSSGTPSIYKINEGQIERV